MSPKRERRSYFAINAEALIIVKKSAFVLSINTRNADRLRNQTRLRLSLRDLL